MRVVGQFAQPGSVGTDEEQVLLSAERTEGDPRAVGRDVG